MANIRAIHSVGQSIATFLSNTYPPTLYGRSMPECDFELLSTSELLAEPTDANRIAIVLYRVAMNEHARQALGRQGRADSGQLSLDLHFLVSAWFPTAEPEQVAFAWTLRQLHLHPVLDASSLSPEAGWARDEVIQLVPNELSNEDMMRLWDAVVPSYRLSASYVARVVRLDPDEDRAEFAPVVARRLAYGTEALP